MHVVRHHAPSEQIISVAGSGQDRLLDDLGRIRISQIRRTVGGSVKELIGDRGVNERNVRRKPDDLIRQLAQPLEKLQRGGRLELL